MSELREPYHTGQSYVAGGSGPVPTQIPDAVHYEAITTDDMACAISVLTGCDIAAARAELRGVITRLSWQVIGDAQRAPNQEF